MKAEPGDFYVVRVVITTQKGKGKDQSDRPVLESTSWLKNCARPAAAPPIRFSSSSCTSIRRSHSSQVAPKGNSAGIRKICPAKSLSFHQRSSMVGGGLQPSQGTLSWRRVKIRNGSQRSSLARMVDKTQSQV